MSEARNITLERVNRLTQLVTDFIESHTQQGRMMMRLLHQMNERLGSMNAAPIDKSMADEEAKYRVSYSALSACTTFRDFDTLSEARAYAQQRSEDEALFMERHRSQLPAITKVVERVV